MKEELIRVEHGCFQHGEREYRFELSVSRGECIGVYVDDHLTSGAAYLGFFKGQTHMRGGKAFFGGRRVSGQVLERQVTQKSTILDKHRFDSVELTVRDFLLALGKTSGRGQRAALERRLTGPEALALMEQMSLSLPMERRLTEVSLLDYYRLTVFRSWLLESEFLILDRLTEILRQRDLDRLMECVRLLQEQGTAVIVFDLDETFMHRCADRIDVVKDQATCYRLYPEEYGETLYAVLGWECRSTGLKQRGHYDGGPTVLRVSDWVFPGMQPMDLEIRGGEIAFLRDENYSTALRLRSCFLDGAHWLSGSFVLGGRQCAPGEVARLIGTEIGIQTERPDRSSGALFEDLTALDNLSLCLLPKAGKHILSRPLTASILAEASRWFTPEALQQPLRMWSLPERLRFSYYKWYLLGPKLLICFFPFAGQETAHHEMIVEMLTLCAERGIAVWVISSGIDAICEKTENDEFLRRLRYIN